MNTVNLKPKKMHTVNYKNDMSEHLKLYKKSQNKNSNSNLILEKIFCPTNKGNAYLKYAKKLHNNFLRDKISTKNKLSESESKSLRNMAKEYYILASKQKNIHAIKQVSMMYASDGEYEKLHDLFTFTNYYKVDNDFCNKILLKCSSTNQNTKLVEIHFEKIVNKTGEIYFILGNYYKKIKCDDLAIKYFKHASGMFYQYSYFMLGTYYIFKKDKINSLKYFLIIFSHKEFHKEKIDTLQEMYRHLKNDKEVIYFLTKEIEKLEVELQKLLKSQKYKFQKIYKYKCMYLYIKFLVFRSNKKFKDANNLIENMYKIISTRKTFDPVNASKKINKIYSDFNTTKKRLNIYLHIDRLIWFEYNKIAKKHYEIFCNYPTLVKNIDRWIRKTEQHYFGLEDINVNLSK